MDFILRVVLPTIILSIIILCVLWYKKAQPEYKPLPWKWHGYKRVKSKGVYKMVKA